MGAKLMKEYPQVLIWSIRSMEEKVLFIVNRLQLKVDERLFPLLCVNFNSTLRPRGEILMRAKKTFNNNTIVELIQMSDQ
jgi:hypothetical protein